MKGYFRKCWGAVKFGAVLGLKFWPRIVTALVAGACRGFMKEVDRVQAEIGDYNARVFGPLPWSKSAKVQEPFTHRG